MFRLSRLLFGALLVGVLGSFFLGGGVAPLQELARQAASLVQPAAIAYAIPPSTSRASLRGLPVVFVHGINDTGDTWDQLKAVFIAERWSADALYAPTFDCKDAVNCSNITNADQINAWVGKASAEHGGSQVILIAHSMGGVSSAYFMTHGSNASKVAALVSIASMKNGIKMPIPCPPAGMSVLGFDLGGTICNQLSRGGNFISGLWRPSFDGVPSINFFSIDDSVISTTAAYVAGACNVRVAGPDHRQMIRNDTPTTNGGIPRIKQRLFGFIDGTPYSTLCDAELDQPSFMQLANGPKKILVVPVKFEDTPESEQFQKPQIETVFGTKDNPGLVNEYFAQVSGGRYAPQFAVTAPVVLSGRLLPVPYPTYGSFGGALTYDDLIQGATVSDGSGNQVDKALCGLGINIARYDGVILLYQDSMERHRAAQRIDARMFETWREGEGLLAGLGNTYQVHVYDCPTGDMKEPQYKSVIQLFTGVSWDDTMSLARTAVHEIGHTIGFGHAATYSNVYGNDFDLMGGRYFAVLPGGLLQSLTGWLDSSRGLQVITQSGHYTLNAVESQQYPTGLLFVNNQAPGERVLLEQHDGTDDSYAIQATHPKKSGLLQITPESPQTWSDVPYVSSTITIKSDDGAGLQPGECGAVEVGSRSAIYRYNADNSVDVKFTDDADFEENNLACGVDLAIRAMVVQGDVVQGQPATVKATVRNVGSKTADGGYTLAYNFINEAGEIGNYGNVSGKALKPGEEEVITFVWTPATAGSGHFVAYASHSYDKNSTNNKRSIAVMVRPSPGQSVPPYPVKQLLTLTGDGTTAGTGSVYALISKGKSVTGYTCQTSRMPCSYSVEAGSQVTLTARPDPSVAFTGFGGAYCDGQKDCVFTMVGVATIQTHFVPTATVVVSTDGSGKDFGTVHVQYQVPGEQQVAECVDDCIDRPITVVAGSRIEVSAVPEQDQSIFYAWSGCVSGSLQTTCVASAPTVGKSLSITATFKKLIPFTFTSSGEMLGAIAMSVVVPGSNGAATLPDRALGTFVETYPQGTQVTLNYKAQSDAPDARVRAFAWSGTLQEVATAGCGAGDTSCSFTLGSEPLRGGLATRYQYRVRIGHEDEHGSVRLVARNPDQGEIVCPPASVGATCTNEWYWKGSTVTATAQPVLGYDFARWSSLECRGEGEVCVRSVGAPMTITAAPFRQHTFSITAGGGCRPGEVIGSINYKNVYCAEVAISVQKLPTEAEVLHVYEGQVSTIEGLKSTERFNFHYDSCLECFKVRTERYLSGTNGPYRFDKSVADAGEGGGLYIEDRDGNNGYLTLTNYEHRAVYGAYDYNDAVSLSGSSNRSLAVADTLDALRATARGTEAPLVAAGEQAVFRLPDMLLALAHDSLVTPPRVAVTASARVAPDTAALLALGRARVAYVSRTFAAPWHSFVAFTERQLVRPMARLAGVGATTFTGGPSLQPRSLWINGCTEQCVISPGAMVRIEAFVTNEGDAATAAAFAARVALHKVGAPTGTNLKELYRYRWNALASGDAAQFTWAEDWYAQEGVYEVTLSVDDWNRVGTQSGTEARTVKVTVSNAPVELTTGVRGEFGGSVSAEGLTFDASGDVCETMPCVTKPVLGSVVQLIARPSEHREFIGWEGPDASDCVTRNFATSTCEVLMSSAKRIIANFETVGPLLTLHVDGENGGTGTIASTNTGGARDFTACADECSRPFVVESRVSLTATPGQGSYFSRWSGADAERCSLTSGGTTCTIKVRENRPIDIHALFVKGTVPTQTITVRGYSSTAATAGGSIKVLDPLNRDAVLGTCETESCTYRLAVPNANGRLLKVVPVPATSSALGSFTSPVVDLTPDGRFSESCGSFTDDLDRLRDGDRATWVTCQSYGRIAYTGDQGIQRITSVEAYLPSISNSSDAGAYEALLKKAVAEWAEVSQQSTSLQFSANGIAGVVSDIMKFVYTPSRNQRDIATIGSLPAKGIQSVSVKASTVGRDESVAGYLDFNVRATTGSDYTSRTYIELPGPAYTDANLANVSLDTYADDTYTRRGFLVIGQNTTVPLSAVPTNTISFTSANGNRMRLGEVIVRGTFDNPCSSTQGGQCVVSLLPTKPLLVPVTYVPSTGGQGVLGDVNKDGKITAADALMALRLAVQASLVGADTGAADANCDGKISASDALRILKTAVGAQTLTSCVAAQAATTVASIDVSMLGSGTGTLEPAFSGENMLFTAVPAPGSTFLGCLGNCTKVSSSTFAVATGGTEPLRVYAQFSSYGIPGVATTTLAQPPPQQVLTLCGDANSSGSVTSDDARLTLNYAVNAATTGVNAKNADANGDGKVTATDANLILKAATGSIVITCGKPVPVSAPEQPIASSTLPTAPPVVPIPNPEPKIPTPTEPTPTPAPEPPPPPAPAPLCGDVNNSRTITAADALATLKLATSGGMSAVADVNGDGKVTATDANLILEAATSGSALTGCKL